MALSATFTANFASFYDAVDKADTKLKDFGAGADKVGGRLTALGNSFSGVKLIQDALLMVKAVEDIGGASKLTEKELARLGTTTNEAVAKMKALGMEVPQNLQKIADQTKGTTKAVDGLGASGSKVQDVFRGLGTDAPTQIKKVGTAAKDASTGLDGIVGSVKGIAGALGIGLSVKSVLDFGKAVIDDAGHIADLSSKIGISTDAVQRFGFAAEQSGGSMDVVGGAIAKMNVTLAGGDKSTVAALDAIGVKFSDIRAMKPEDAFTTITKAIAGIADPMAQAEAATKLFGKTGQELLPAIKQGFVDAAASAPVMADAVIQAADRIGDRLARLKRETLNAGGELIGGLELMVETSYSYIDELNTKAFQSVEERAKHAKDSVAAMKTALGTDKADLSGYLGGFGMDLGGPKTMADDLRIATAAMKDLTAEQRKNIDAGIALGNSADDIAAKTHIAADVVKLYTDQQKKATDAEKKATDAATEHLKKINDLAASLSGVGLTQKTKDLNEAVALSALRFGRAALNTQATVDAVRALAREGAALPPLLRDIYLRHLDWAGAGVKVEVGIKSILTDLPNYTQQLKNFMNVQFFNFKLPDFKTQIGNLFQDLPNLAPQFKQWGAQNITAPMKQTVDETNAIVGLVATAFDALGQHGGAAFQTAMKFGEIAITGMIKYKAAITDAERETIALQTTTAIATFGMTAAITLFYNVWKEHQDRIHVGQQQIHDLQQEIITLGQTPTPQGGPLLEAPPSLGPLAMDQGRINALTQQIKDFHAAQQAALDEQNKLNTAVQKYALTWADLEGSKQIEAVHKQFSDLTETFVRLNAAGYSTTAIAHGMKDELNDMVRTAIATGQKIPPIFLPLLAQLAKSGDLADDVKRKLLGIADPAPWKDMEEAANRYGISIDSLGKQFQQAKLTDTADALVKDWDLLVGHGADVNAVISGMSGKVNDLVHDSLKLGIDIPANMKPMLQAMADAGTLTDENGTKLTDLTKLHFAADLAADFDKLILKLDELIDKLGGDHPNSVAGAAESTADHIEKSFNDVRINPIHVPYVFDADNPPDFDVNAGGRASPRPMARGGIVTRPTFALIGEAGPEAVVPLGAGGALAAPIHITVVSTLDGREVARNQVRYIPRELQRAGL